VNKDRRASVAILSELVSAYDASGKVMPNVVFTAIHNAIGKLADTEALSMKKMEAYKDNAGTAVNYDNARKSHDGLLEALDHLASGDAATAAGHLLYVAEGCPSIEKLQAVVPKKSSKKGLVKSRAVR